VNLNSIVIVTLLLAMFLRNLIKIIAIQRKYVFFNCLSFDFNLSFIRHSQSHYILLKRAHPFFSG
jgi:hypothetical protein